nr:DUF538 domain-containing protein [Tanacetum cinerariifolium]
MGLLPKGVTNFTIDDMGHFEVHLDQACNAKFEDELHYDRNVIGNISFGQIGGLSGTVWLLLLIKSLSKVYLRTYPESLDSKRTIIKRD